MTTEQLTIEQAKNIVFGIIAQAEANELSVYTDNNAEIARSLRAMWGIRTTNPTTARNGASDTAKLAIKLAKRFAK